MPHVDVIAGMLAETVDPEGEVLCIGLGAGFLPRKLDPIACRTVEIDPAVVDVAERFFGFDRGRFPVVLADGRAALLADRRRYQAIVLDAFRGMDLPYHLLTRECFELARARLSPDGVLVLNYEGPLTGQGGRLVRSIERTLRAVFEEVDLLVADRPTARGNVIFAARGSGVEIDWPDRRGYAPRQGLLDDRPARVLTDSRNPTALWSARQARRPRGPGR